MYLKEITNQILRDYEAGRFIDKTDVINQPDKRVVTDILTKLQEIIFPGFFKPRTYKTYTLDTTITMLIEDVLSNLRCEVAKTLRYNPEASELSDDELCERANALSMEFLSKIPLMREYISGDVDAAFDGDPAAYNREEIVVTYPGFYAITVNRIAHELYRLGVPLIPRIMTEHAHSLTGIDIHPGATIGRNFFIDHGTGIVVGETTVIGDNVKIYQGVTLGALSTRGGQSLKSTKRHPTIEDNVTIYSNATILGGDTVIGEGAVIGGNTFITASVGAGQKIVNE